MRNLIFAALLAVAAATVVTPLAVVAQTNLPPAWGTTNSSSGSPFKKAPAKPTTSAAPAAAQPVPVQPVPVQPVPAQPVPAQPMATQPAAMPQPAPVLQPSPVAVQPVYSSPAPAPVAPPAYSAQPVYAAPVPQAAPVATRPAEEPAQPAPVAAPASPAPVYQAEPIYAPPAQPAQRSPVAEPANTAPMPVPVQPPVQQPAAAAAPVYTAPVYQAQPVYAPPAYAAPAPQPVQAVPVQAAPVQASQPVYAAPAPQPVQPAPPAQAIQPVYLPSNSPAAQAAPAPLPTLNPPTKAERKRARANQQDRAIEAAAAQGPQSQNANPWIDVSAALSPAVTPVYEGNPPLQVKFTMDMEHGDALDLSQIDMGTHTGTHVDAPLHFVRGAPSIDEVALDRLIGPAVVLDIDPRVIAITGAELSKYKWQGAKRVIFRTRNSVNSWIIDPQFHRDFTFLAPDAAQMLADSGVLLVGIDYLSIEQFGAFKPLTHQILLSRGIPIVEGLDLRTVIPGEYDLMVLPLKILGHEAAPARAVLRAR